MLTADTITAAQIKELREEAMTASDYLMVDLCDVALASRERSNDDGSHLEDSDGNPTTRSEARARLAEILNARECQHPECEEPAGHSGRHTFRCDDGSCCEPPEVDAEEVAAIQHRDYLARTERR